MKNAFVVILMIAFIAVLALGDRRTPEGERPPAPRTPSTVANAPADERRWAAFRLHRGAQWEKAVAAYGELLRENPRDTELLYFRGVAHWDLQRFAEAEDDFRALVALEPTHFKAHEHLDQLLSRTRRYDECVALWTAYTRTAPRDPEGHYLRGWAFLRAGDTARALADVARACELGKDEACKRADSLKERLEQGR